MGLYVKETDFVGLDVVAKDKFSVDELNSIIEEFEVTYLIDLLGCDLYNEFKTDFAILGDKPTNPKFTVIWNPICTTIDECQLRSRGIKAMLVSLIYFDYLRETVTKKNIGGLAINQQVNSVQGTFSATNIYQEWNRGALDSSAIQYYICVNPEEFDYDSYAGITIRPTSQL